ncbi:hypothetical protein ACFQ60_23150 [Streptomyces zhihengii]
MSGNLTEVTSALLASGGPALSALVITRPGATERFREAMTTGAPGFTAIEDAIAAYLRAEQPLGRVPASLDARSTALALVATAHHLLMTADPATPDPAAQMERLVTTLTRE